MKELKLKVKKVAKNYIEDIKRKRHKNNIFSFREKNKVIRFFLPYRRDHIQQQIIVKNNFYDSETLKKTDGLVKKGAVFLDIGSNIGNHAVYYGRILEAKKVYGFEPVESIFSILKKNIELNGLKKSVTVFNFGLGSSNGNAEVDIDGFKSDNCGSTSIKESAYGELRICTLDSLKIEEKIDFIKIDTEGFEKDVLLGGKETIKKSKPIIWVEITKNKKEIFDYLKKLGYGKPIKLNAENHLFKNNS